MIKKALVFAVAAACLTSGAAFAQSYDYRNDGYQQRSNTYERQDRYDRSDRYDRNDNRQDYSRHDGYNRDHRYDSRSHGYRDAQRQQNRYERRQMRRGERLSQYDRADYYVVNDWRSRRLHAPQRGYHWVQSGNDYALVAIATGIIASVLLNR
jgi:Ni/Co efflux regulator RcnB